MNATAGALPFQGQQVITHKRLFVVAVTAYMLVSMARIHEILPALGPLHLGALTGMLALASAATTLRKDVLSAIGASPVTKGLAVVVLFTVLTVPTSVWPLASFNYVTRVYYNAILLFVVTAAVFADRRASRVVVVALVACVALAGLYAMAMSQKGRYEMGFTYDPNETASLFMMTVPWAIYLLLTEKGLLRLLGMASIPVFVMGMLKTGSRGGLLTAAALVPFLLVLSPPKRRAPFMLLVVAGALATALAMGDQAVYRLRKAFDTTEYNYTTEDGRVEIWKRGLSYIKGNPVLGVGMNAFQYKELESKSNKGYGIRQAAAHNMYIQVAAELGLIGFSGFLAMLVGAHSLCIVARRRARAAIARGGGEEAQRDLLRANMAQASLFALMCSGFFLSLGYSAMVYFAVAVSIGVSIASRTGGTPGAPTSVTPPRRVRGMRGWRSGRTVPAGLHGMSTPQH